MRRFVIAVAAVLFAALAGPVAAQGTSGTLPGPISTPELDRYARRLDLGLQQRAAVLSYHDDYKRQFGQLRDGEIAEFLQQVHGIQSAGRIPPSAEVAAIFERMDTLNRKIRVLDDRLFDRLLPLLTEDQLTALPRVRKVRARKRFSSTDMEFTAGGSPVDLSELVFELDLDPETAESIDGVVLVYEDAMTRKMSALYGKATKVMLRMIEELEKRGLTDMSMTDPEAMKKFAEAGQEIMRDIAGETAELSQDMKKLNRRTAGRIIERLPPTPRARFRRQWLDRTYGSIGPSLRWPSERFGRALDDESIDSAKRQTLAALLDRTDREMDVHAERSIKQIEELWDEQATMGFDMEFWQRQQEVVKKVTEEARAFDLRVETEIDRILGEGTAATLARGPASQPAAAQSVAAANDGATPQPVIAAAAGVDPYVPAAIGAQQVSQWAKRLGLDEDHRAVMIALHEEYGEHFQSLAPVHFKPLLDARNAFHKNTSDVKMERVVQQAAEIHRLRVQAMDAVRAADDVFLDEVEQVLYEGEGPPVLEAIRLGRRRQTCSLAHFGGLVPGGGTVDLIGVIVQQRLDDASLAAIEPAILAFERETAPLYENRWRVSLDVKQANDRWPYEVRDLQKADTDEPDYLAWGERYKEIVGDRMANLVDAERAIGKLQRQSLDTIVEMLEPEPGERVRAAYFRRAVPDVFNDATTVERHVTEALALPDLSGGQRREIEDIAAEYRPEYRRVSDRMIEIALATTAPWYANNDRKVWADYQARQDEMARLRFTRSEASGRANTALRRILSEDQLKRIGGLPAME